MSEQDASSFVGYLLTTILTPFLAPLHFAAATWFSFVLFGLAGGIETDGRLTHYGGIEYAWTNLAWLPGGLLLAAGDFLTGVGFLLLMAGSAITGLTTAASLASLLSRRRPRFGRWAWQLVVAARNLVRVGARSSESNADLLAYGRVLRKGRPLVIRSGGQAFSGTSEGILAAIAGRMFRVPVNQWTNGAD